MIFYIALALLVLSVLSLLFFPQYVNKISLNPDKYGIKDLDINNLQSYKYSAPLGGILASLFLLQGSIVSYITYQVFYIVYVLIFIVFIYFIYKKGRF